MEKLTRKLTPKKVGSCEGSVTITETVGCVVGWKTPWQKDVTIQHSILGCGKRWSSWNRSVRPSLHAVGVCGFLPRVAHHHLDVPVRHVNGRGIELAGGALHRLVPQAVGSSSPILIFPLSQMVICLNPRKSGSDSPDRHIS